MKILLKNTATGKLTVAVISNSVQMIITDQSVQIDDGTTVMSIQDYIKSLPSYKTTNFNLGETVK